MKASPRDLLVALCLFIASGIVTCPALAAEGNQCQHGASISLQATTAEAQSIAPATYHSSNGTANVVYSKDNSLVMTIPDAYADKLIEFAIPNAKCSASFIIKGTILSVQPLFNFFPAAVDNRFSKFVVVVVDKAELSLNQIEDIVSYTKYFTVTIE